MGDRNNPIKFGPEWLRNLARERSAARTNTSQSQNNARAGSSLSTRSGSSPPSSAGATGGAGSRATSTALGAAGPSGAASSANASTSSGANTRNTTTNPVPKVQLAKLRYGREEMLALYDRTAEAPEELKYFELLYQPRGKPPVALSTFEEKTRDSVRGGPPISGMSAERFSAGRGAGRGAVATDVRGRSRMPFVRHPAGPSTGRGLMLLSSHGGGARLPGFSAGEEEPARPWSASNGSLRTGVDQPDWAANKLFRRRQANNTNWRQTSRDEGDEWRNQEGSRSQEGPRTQEGRPPNRSLDKWDREWGDRPAQERSPSWNSNRRTWQGGDSQNNEDNLPEWAVDSAEAGAGTFDSSGAFHGYSNDDSNLPKPETTYALTRSHTHNSLNRSKTVEEGSEEWWASEKAKKLLPKRFDAGDIKYKKSLSTGSNETNAGSGANKQINMDDLQEIPEKLEKAPPEPDSTIVTADDSKENALRQKFSESKTFDALMRSDIDFSESSDERSNFQSVMLTPNNSLRQKHQNIVTSSTDHGNRQGHGSGLLHMLHGIQHPMNAQNAESDSTQGQTTEDKIVVDLIDMTLDDSPLPKSKMLQSSLQSNTSNAGMVSQMQNTNPGLQLPSMPAHGIALNTTPSMATSAMQAPNLQNIGIQNSALNSSLGLPIGGPGTNGMGMPLQGVMPPVMQNSQINTAMGTAMQSRTVIGAFQPNNGMPVMPPPNVANSSLFMAQSNAPKMPTSNDIPLPSHGTQSNLYQMHGLQQSSSQYNSIYNTMMSQGPPQGASNAQALADQWYYEDPEKIIQGPFTSKEMYNWYQAGFFSPSLMVRRACEAIMRPLGSYGPVVPFAQLDVLSPFPMGGFESRPQGTHEMLNQQAGLGIEEHPSINNTNNNRVESLPFGIQAPPRIEPRPMDSLWGQPGPSQDMLWMQQAMTGRTEARVNNLPMFFWDPQPTPALSSNSLIPEEIAKEMKTEDQILAQLRASQNLPVPPSVPFLNDSAPATSSSTTINSDDNFSTNAKLNPTPDLEELQKLMHNDNLSPPVASETKIDNAEREVKSEKPPKVEQTPTNIEAASAKTTQQQKSETKSKQAKNETEKSSKTKENNATKTKKKAKEDRKDEQGDIKSREEEIKPEKASVESSPIKSKKEDKQNKKELEKEKKEWIKEGFTIVKGPEKTSSKESKKKAEEAKAAEEADRKKKEEEKLAAEEEKKKKLAESTKKQQDQQQRQQLSDSLSKKAPWSAPQPAGSAREGPTLAEIQRLEREKKLEQMKEQQQMMHIIAQQQAAALAREQEMQANLAWAKKKSSTNNSGQSLAEIQAETRRQAAAAAAAAAAQAVEETVAQPPPVNHVPWGNSHNGGGFWDTQPTPAKPEKAEKEVKSKRKVVPPPPKKEVSPAVEFDNWCGAVLTSWSSKIDVPTFVGFLKDIESPYEVKDYVKCYLGESKDSSDFARQFLERRSKLLRVGMVTPSDDLCSPALAVTPRVASLADYQEVKGKGKKSKKNKMLKVDARILGFSVTAAEDRINVGDIDTV